MKKENPTTHPLDWSVERQVRALSSETLSERLVTRDRRQEARGKKLIALASLRHPAGGLPPFDAITTGVRS